MKTSKILIVDDNELIAKSLKIALTQIESQFGKITIDVKRDCQA